MSTLNLNETTIEEPKGFGPLPAEEFNFIVDDGEVEELRSGKGTAWKLVLKVLGGDHDNKKSFQRFNVFHDSDVAQDIARQQIKMIAIAGNKSMELNSPRELVGAKFTAKIKHEEYNEKTQERIAYIKKMDVADDSAGVFS